MKRLSLRARLLLGMVGLVLVALSIFGVTTVILLRGYLTDRADTRLLEARAPFQNAQRSPFEGRFPGESPDRGPRRFGGTSFAVVVFDEQGAPLATVPSGFADSPDPLPDIPALTPQLAAQQYPAPFTIGAQGDPSFRYRALATPIASDQRVIVMAVPLNADQATIERVLLVEFLVAVAVLGLVALVGYRVVGVGLRPLDDMTEVATEIAGGDLSHRIDLPEDRRDEVGRLGQAMNGMLTQIEAAFGEKELSEEQLRQFVADASHELRTPLTSIRGYAELYRRGALGTDEAVADAMRRIEEESSRMGVLVDDLLLLARLDQGRPLEDEPVDLVGVAADAIRDAQASDPGRRITFDHDPTVVVSGDRVRLHQVVANLLDNVRVHTEATTAVWVAVRAEGGSAELSVRDDGPGLAPELAARVFERSFRGDPTRQGTGLGLSIVAAIAAAHGGRAGVASELGRGTTFTVRLPLAVVPAFTENSQEPSSRIQRGQVTLPSTPHSENQESV